MAVPIPDTAHHLLVSSLTLLMPTRARTRADGHFPELIDNKFTFGKMTIVASNDINEATLTSLYLHGIARAGVECLRACPRETCSLNRQVL